MCPLSLLQLCVDSNPLSILSVMLKYLLAFRANSSFPVLLGRDEGNIADH